jgi:hypothetical protein
LPSKWRKPDKLNRDKNNNKNQHLWEVLAEEQECFKRQDNPQAEVLSMEQLQEEPDKTYLAPHQRREEVLFNQV